MKSRIQSILLIVVLLTIRVLFKIEGARLKAAGLASQRASRYGSPTDAGSRFSSSSLPVPQPLPQPRSDPLRHIILLSNGPGVRKGDVFVFRNTQWGTLTPVFDDQDTYEQAIQSYGEGQGDITPSLLEYHRCAMVDVGTTGTVLSEGPNLSVKIKFLSGPYKGAIAYTRSNWLSKHAQTTP